MIQLLSTIFLFAVISFANRDEDKVAYPQIVTWKNSPVIEFEQNKKAILKKNQLLKNAFTVTTSALDEIHLKFSRGESLIILPGSKVLVPYVSPDTGEINEINLIDGQVRFQSSSTANKKLHFKSVFFDLNIPPQVELFITVDRKQPLVQLQMVQGEMTAVFFDFEKTQLLKAGESITFKGERDGENIKYDYLLNSRKAPHGVLLPVEKFDATIYSDQEKAQEKAKKLALEKRKKEAVAQRKKQQAFENSFLCHKPYGQKDQCHWQLKEGLCFRSRCNVSGEWGDETERPVKSALCQSQKIELCDY